MTNLEFIEKEIYINKNKIENDKKHLISLEKYKLNDELEQMIATTRLETNITIYEANIKYLQQIKTVLEAWEVVKEFIRDSNGVYLLRLDSDDDDDKEHYEKLKKALEVEDE